ncbi:MAG: SEC-C domain-containing protein, partial [Acidobacteriales bacterium]|nr:SEC-C domain-containing protein [Terriglobales bacterium]
GLDQKELILDDYVESMLGDLLDEFAPDQKHPDEWDYAGLKNQIFTRCGVDIVTEGIEAEKLNRQELGDAIFGKLKERYDAKERLLGADAMRYHERMIMLSVLDQLWKDHLLNMDHLKEGIGLRGYGQHDPLVEYKRESFDMFEAMMKRFREDTVRYLYLMQIVEQAAALRPAAAPISGDGNGRGRTSLDEIELEFQRKKRRELEQARLAGAGDLQPVQQVRRSGDKVGRNDPCPCGSGKKYKKCHGVTA